ncbi:hypothetical protein ES705_31104 [subsurface metagenome]
MARLTKLTKKTFIKTFKNNGQNISNACEVVGTSRDTYYKELGRSLKFKQAIENIKKSANDELITLAKKGLKVNLKRNKQSAIEYVLNNKTGGEYSNTVKNELTGAGGGPINWIIELTYEQSKPNMDKTDKIDPKAD